MIRNAIVLSFSLLMLPTLSLAECTDKTAVECSNTKAAEAKQSETIPDDDSHASLTTIEGSETGLSNTPTTANSRQVSSSRNKRRAERRFSSFEPADPRDTVLSSEICVYSSASYTYSCR